MRGFGRSIDPQCRNCLQFIDWSDHPVLENSESAERRKHFCDERCLDLYLKRECTFCGDPVGVGGVGFHRQPANNPYFDGRIRARFCDDECRQEWKDGMDVREDYVPASERPDPWQDSDAPQVKGYRAEWSTVKFWLAHLFYCRFRENNRVKKVIVNDRGDKVGFRWDCDCCGTTFHNITSVTIET